MSLLSHTNAELLSIAQAVDRQDDQLFHVLYNPCRANR